MSGVTHIAHGMRAVVALALAACGPPGGPVRESDTGAGVDSCGADVTFATPVRRLSQDEYARTVTSLTTVPVAPGVVLDDPEVHGFADTTAAAVGVLGADRYLRAAETVTASLGEAVPVCGADRSCLDEVLDELGTRAFRRPLEPGEREILLGLHEEVRAVDTDVAARDALVQALLQSPQFLYRVESAGSGGALDGYGLATRLAFFLWGEGPDAALLARASSGGLDAPEGVAATVDDMLEDPRARNGVADFVEQWMGTARVESLQRDAQRFPQWDAALASALREETRAFAGHVVFDGEGTLSALLTAPYTVTGPEGARIYGLERDEVGVLPLDPGERAGILTQPAALATGAHDNQTSITLRGLMVRERILCQPLPLPPDDLDITLPPLDDELSTRERFARHSQDPACSGCHTLMDPVGLGFEHFDPIGAWRDAESSGVLVDASGHLSGAPDASLDGHFYGVPELAQRLAASPSVSECFARNAVRFAWARDPGLHESCAVARAATALEDSGGDIRSLLGSIATDPAFTLRTETPR